MKRDEKQKKDVEKCNPDVDEMKLLEVVVIVAVLVVWHTLHDPMEAVVQKFAVRPSIFSLLNLDHPDLSVHEIQTVHADDVADDYYGVKRKKKVVVVELDEIVESHHVLDGNFVPLDALESAPDFQYYGQMKHADDFVGIVNCDAAVVSVDGASAALVDVVVVAAAVEKQSTTMRMKPR